MIVGKGNVAAALKDVDTDDDIIFFASGVSDSSCVDVDEFDREERLLMKQDRNKHLVYFSSLSRYRSDSEYNKHKRRMEFMVTDQFPFYTIVRVEVITWGRNETTIHNVFRKKIANAEEVQIRDETRYLLTKEEFQYWIDLIPKFERTEMNIPGKKYSIQEIYDMVKKGEL